jgi:hypothetical protein
MGCLVVRRDTRASKLLSLVDIFEPLSKEEIEQLNGQLSDVHLKPDEISYTPQDRSEKLFVLWKGRVRIYKTIEGCHTGTHPMRSARERQPYENAGAVR